MNKKGIFKLIITIIILLIAGFFWFTKTQSQNNQPEDLLTCETDADCVPANCCHATSCVAKAYAPDCNGIFCTAVCEEGTLDCGQGSCGCINGQCQGVIA